jgi:hypothetical protein
MTVISTPQPCQEEGEMNQATEIFNDTSKSNIYTDVKPASPLRSIRKHCHGAAMTVPMRSSYVHQKAVLHMLLD